MSAEFADILVLALALIFAAIATFPALQNRSPVFVAVLLMARSKDRSLSLGVLDREMKKRIQGRELLFLSEKGGYISKHGGRYRNTRKGRFVGALFGAVQRGLALGGEAR